MSARWMPEGGTAGKRQGLTPWTVIVTVIASIVLLGLDTKNAQQSFSDPLAASIDRIQEGSAFRQAAVAMLAVWAVLSLIKTKSVPTRGRMALAIPLLALLAVVMLSPVWAIDPDLTMRRVVLTALLLLGAFALARTLKPSALAGLTLIVSSIVVIAATAAQLAFGPFQPLNGEWRLAGLFHPVAVSWYCCLGALAAVYIATREPRRRLLPMALAAGFFVALVLTRTRTGLAALAVGMLILAYFHFKSHRRALVASALVALGIGVFAVILGGALGLTWSSAYSDLVEWTSLGRPEAVSQITSFTGRLPVWETSLSLVERRPIIGFGYNAFSSPELLGLFAASAGWVPSSSHSGYIDALLSLGLVGLFLFVCVLIIGLFLSCRFANADSEYAFGAAVLGWLFINLFVESSVMFEANYVSLLILTILVKLSWFGPEEGRSQHDVVGKVPSTVPAEEVPSLRDDQ